jgi:UDP-N-acetyl-D-glucosamine dehydrogenase
LKQTAGLRRRILSRRAGVAVVGQGYAGLSVACEAAAAGFPVVGIDIDATRINDLKGGVLSVAGVDDLAFRSGVESGRLEFQTDPQAVANNDIVLICVPTPIRDDAPDMSYVEKACRDVAAHLSPGTLVVLESTTYPGSTELLAKPLLEQSGLGAGRDFLLAYSPERVNPGDSEFGFRNIPRIVGGLTAEATGVCALFYGQFVDKVLSMGSARAAELAKLLENTFRHVNIALVNEMSMLCHDMGIDVWEIVDAAASKPFGFMPFYPGPGVGGHCIPVDPAYLAWHVRRQAGRRFRLLEQAQDINSQMPNYVVSRLAEALNNRGRALKDARVLILGISYKPDVGDVRESPALKVMGLLAKSGANVSFHDPFVEEAVAESVSYRRIDLTQRAVQTSDCVAVLTPHSHYDFDWLAENASVVFDARNAYRDDRRPNVDRL